MPRWSSGAERRQHGSGGRLFTGVFETAASAPGHMLLEIRVPKLVDSTGWSYIKHHRRAQDWAVVGVAAVVRRENGSVAQAAVALTNMGGTPLRAKGVEEALAGGASVADAAAHAAEGTEPSSDTPRPRSSASISRACSRVARSMRHWRAETRNDRALPTRGAPGAVCRQAPISCCASANDV